MRVNVPKAEYTIEVDKTELLAIDRVLDIVDELRDDLESNGLNMFVCLDECKEEEVIWTLTDLENLSNSLYLLQHPVKAYHQERF